MKKILLAVIVMTLVSGLILSFKINDKTVVAVNDINSVKEIKKPKNPFVGTWAWAPKDSSEVFSLNIKLSGGKLIGLYCDVFDNGKKMDCTDNEPSFSIPIPQGNTCTVSFISSYSAKPGIAKLTASGGKLIWKVVRPAPGEHYCPTEAILVK